GKTSSFCVIDLPSRISVAVPFSSATYSTPLPSGSQLGACSSLFTCTSDADFRQATTEIKAPCSETTSTVLPSAISAIDFPSGDHAGSDSCTDALVSMRDLP